MRKKLVGLVLTVEEADKDTHIFTWSFQTGGFTEKLDNHVVETGGIILNKRGLCFSRYTTVCFSSLLELEI